MLHRIKRLGAALKGLRREDGNATIEFVLLFPALITVFLMVVETGVILIRGTMLDRAVDISMRELRLGTLSPMTHDGLKQSICDNSLIIQNCGDVILVELRPISTATWTPLEGATTCVNRSEEVQPVLDFVPGLQNEMMLVRVCAVFDPFFPTGQLAAQIKMDDQGGYALVAMSAYVNEP